MPIFHVIETEEKVQVNDKTRIDASKSYTAAETITKIEIEPEAAAGYFNTGTSGILDWQYAAAGAKVVTTKITTTQTPAGTTATKTITCVTEADDNLFSNDDRLRAHETDILKYVAAGRSSFKDVHRLAQKLILEWFAEQGYRKAGNVAITAADVADKEEVAEWATYLALRLIHAGISNAVDDVFDRKAKYYKGKEVAARSRSVVFFDINADGEKTSDEVVNSWSGTLSRR